MNKAVGLIVVLGLIGAAWLMTSNKADETTETLSLEQNAEAMPLVSSLASDPSVSQPTTEAKHLKQPSAHQAEVSVQADAELVNQAQPIQQAPNAQRAPSAGGVESNDHRLPAPNDAPISAPVSMPSPKPGN
ncbi:hypothetical protein BEL05_13685 [Shewanella colwelliana]|uniref:Uncharacterized protein n=1 Tax=Shewanella colwelliana TaxID=23 RepID=A0A1E5IRZ5_SHECO|nr:hypothetical protein [Shewanella colwelliana]OEG73314.1 hypothetical protein BEL05_13685 [Shewanella colwelliana]